MSGRLSVELAADHVENGHGGKYEPYCYRCQYFDEVSMHAATQLAAIQKTPWPWFGGWPTLRRFVGLGSDEFQRRTVWVGPLVIPLWQCRCSDCRADLKRLREMADEGFGQRDRDKQRG